VTDATHELTEANRETIRHAFAAWQSGTRPISDLLAADLVWRIEGHSLASKEYSSKQQFIDEVLAPFGARFSESGPFRPTRIMRLRDGLVVDGTAFYDSISFNDLWTRVTPRSAGGSS
jgi:ketosteroid isomerase-like protein